MLYDLGRARLFLRISISFVSLFCLILVAALGKEEAEKPYSLYFRAPRGFTKDCRTGIL